MASGDLNFWIVAATILVGLTAVVYFFGKEFSKGFRITGSGSSKPTVATGPLQLTKCPADIQKLNDTVYELYSPKGVPEVDLVFFHGLQLGDYKHAFWSTWLSEDGSLVWPKEWLSKSFPNARILAVSYDSCAKRISTTGHIDMYRLGVDLLNNVVLNSNTNVGRNSPVILVGHSLGGLAIKQFIISSHTKWDQMDSTRLSYNYDRIDDFFSNFCGLFFYGTPHAGSRLAELTALFPTSSPIMSFLRSLNTETAKINAEFKQLHDKLKIQVYTVAESLPTKFLGFEAVVVPEAFAKPGSDGVTAEPFDHFSICKPEDMKSNRFQALENFILATLPQGAIKHVKTSEE